MKSFFDFLSEQIPWLSSAISWIIGISIIFLILMLPAYFIFWPFFERVRQKLDDYIPHLSEWLDERRRKRKERLDQSADEFLGDNGLRRVRSKGEGYWVELNEKLVYVSKKLRTPVNGAAQSLNEIKEQITVFRKQIGKPEIDKAQPLPALPESIEEIVDAAATLRIAWMKLILSGTILFGLMLVNTGMLSQILRDLGVVPATITFLGIPLSYVFAFILTLVEAGLGVAHGATREKEPDKLFGWSAFMIVFAFILACVEGFFYSRVAPSTGVFTVPFISYNMPQANLFFLWGFVLVMTLFSLGSISFEAGSTVVRGTKSGTLRREIRKLSKAHERYTISVEASRKNLDEAKKVVSDIDNVIYGPATNCESVREQLDFVLVELKRLRGETPEWAQEEDEKLTRSEVYQLAQTGGIWLIFTLLGIGAVTLTGLKSFEAFYPNLSRAILWIMAVGQAVVFLGIGFLFSTGLTVVQGAKGERRVLTAPKISRIASYIIGGLLVVTYLTLLFTLASPIGMGTVWFSNLVVGLFLIAAGYQLSPLLNTVRLWLLRLWNSVLSVFEILGVALLRLILVIIVVMENIFYLLAMPLENFSRKRQERKALVQT